MVEILIYGFNGLIISHRKIDQIKDLDSGWIHTVKSGTVYACLFSPQFSHSQNKIKL